MNKVKSLKKKIRRLKARIEEDTKRLEKLARKLGAAKATVRITAQRESSVRTSKTRKPAQAASFTERKKGGSTPKPSVKPVAAARQKRRSAPKAKRKLNLTPERRAQLSATMKARWEAKRAAAAGEKHGDAAN